MNLRIKSILLIDIATKFIIVKEKSPIKSSLSCNIVIKKIIYTQDKNLKPSNI